MACFGGAGGQHACAVAKSLGIKTVVVPRYAGILSAYGLALADVVYERQEPAGKELTKGKAGKVIRTVFNHCVYIVMIFI